MARARELLAHAGRAAMAALGASQVESGNGGSRCAIGAMSAGGKPCEAARRTRRRRSAIPAWLARKAAPLEARPPRPLAPSAIAPMTEAAPPPSAAQRAAAQRGILIHSLLERLAGVAAGASARGRAALARALGRVRRRRRTRDGDRRRGVRNPRRSAFRDVVRPGIARRSADCRDAARRAGDRGHGRPFAGRASRISVIDFKTGRVPAGAADIPASHRAQMDAYAEALRVIFPGREVRAALLYTAGPRLFELGVERRRANPHMAVNPCQEIIRHGHQDRHRPELCQTTCSAPGAGAGRFLGRMVRAVPDDRPALEEIADRARREGHRSPSSTSTKTPTRRAAMACAESRPCCCSRAASRSRRRSAPRRAARSSNGSRASCRSIVLSSKGGLGRRCFH